MRSQNHKGFILFILFTICFLKLAPFYAHAQETPLTIQISEQNVSPTTFDSSPVLKPLNPLPVDVIATIVIPATDLKPIRKEPIQAIYSITQVTNQPLLITTIPKETSLLGQSISGAEIDNNTIELGTDTTGNYQKTTSAGNGLSVSGTEGEGWTATISLGNLGSDWEQSAPYDLTLNNTSSELKILGSGGNYYATLDAGSLSADATFIFSGSSGTVITTGNSTTTALNLLTINGLTITNSGNNVLNIAAGKTLTASSSLTLTGTDNTTMTFPSGSDNVVGRTSTDTLTNKTISANSNTITGLTNSNLTGSAAITNANLANSTVTITAGSGLSNGGTISLGGAVSLTNAGVTSLIGTTNQVNVSGSTGSVTLSLPQNVDTDSSPTYAAINLTNNSNQLTLGTTNTGTLTWSPSTTKVLTLPDVTDTLVGKTTTDILTNKTLTSPAINGTVTTTGLTLPAFTASGNITGSGSLTVDSGSDTTLNIGNTNTNALTIGRSGVTTTINGLTTTNNLTIGGGTTITKHLSGSASLDFGATAAGTCDSLTITVTSAADGDTVACGIPNTLATSSTYQTFECFVSSTNTVTVKRCNLTNALIALSNPSPATVRVDVWQH